MWIRVCLSFALLAAMPAWSQVTIGAGAGPGYTDGLGSIVKWLRRLPVNGDSYPTAAGAEVRSNYLRAGLIVTTAYSDNVLGDAVKPVSDVEYLITPTIAIDKTTSRQHLMLAYSPGFTIYQHTSALNQTSQNLTLHLQYRVSSPRHSQPAGLLRETSNVLNQPDSLSTDVISGSTPSVCRYRSRGRPDRQ